LEVANILIFITVDIFKQTAKKIRQTKKMAKNMRDPNVINYVRHLLRGVHAGIRDSKNRKKRSVFGGGVQLRRVLTF
jgi:hypothetical protein